MTTEEKIEYLDNNVRVVIQKCIKIKVTFYFCLSAPPPNVDPEVYDVRSHYGHISMYKLNKYRLLDALHLVGGYQEGFSDAFIPDDARSIPTVPYNQFKLEILDKAIELLKSELK